MLTRITQQEMDTLLGEVESRRPLLRSTVGRHRFELWQAYDCYQIIHWIGETLVPLHRTEFQETRARGIFERTVENYTNKEHISR